MVFKKENKYLPLLKSERKEKSQNSVKCRSPILCEHYCLITCLERETEICILNPHFLSLSIEKKRESAGASREWSFEI